LEKKKIDESRTNIFLYKFWIFLLNFKLWYNSTKNNITNLMSNEFRISLHAVWLATRNVSAFIDLSFPSSRVIAKWLFLYPLVCIHLNEHSIHYGWRLDDMNKEKKRKRKYIQGRSVTNTKTTNIPIYSCCWYIANVRNSDNYCQTSIHMNIFKIIQFIFSYAAVSLQTNSISSSLFECFCFI
jgi:hypothetical protein